MKGMQTKRHFRLTLLLLLLGCTGSIFLSATLGYLSISLSDIINISLSHLGIGPSPEQTTESYVLLDVRLPRILLATLVGASLAISGVIYQGILLNPLADPYTLGISSGAAFGASLSLIAGLSMAGQFSTPIFAFVGGLITLYIVMRLSTFDGQISPQTLILSGVIVSAILSAGISFLKYLADEQVAVIIFWLMGSFAASTWDSVFLVAVSLLFGLAICIFYARDLNIISLGKRSSDSLGVDTARVRRILLVTASLITAVSVAVTGIIGFIGLIIPHLMRYLLGPDNRILLPASALSGAIILLLADTLTRAVLPVEVPIGVLTALIGGPFFCVIFRTRQRGKRYE